MLFKDLVLSTWTLCKVSHSKLVRTLRHKGSKLSWLIRSKIDMEIEGVEGWFSDQKSMTHGIT